MIGELTAWADLGIRWLHLTAGIAWIGSSFYFMWLDSHLKPPAQPRELVSGELWSVHSGGFYQQQKFLVAPPEMPADLHWFKWEAYTTWVSGFLLLSLLYYLGADLYLIDKGKLALTEWQAIAIGLGSLAGGWLVYDGLCRSPLGQNLKVFSAIWFAILVAASWGLTQVFADRGAFMHVGGIVGTVMAANVLMVIIPNQRKMVAQLTAGETPDGRLGKIAKQRSVHNNYMTLPVLFIMISNHYPMVFASDLNWLVLAGLGVTGWVIRHFFNLKNAGQLRLDVLGYGLLAGVATAVVAQAGKPRPAAEAGTPVAFAEVRAILGTHCIACHSAHPTHRGVPVAPNGAAFDTPEEIRKYAGRIHERAVATESMPQGNATGMTPAERQKLGAWIAAGAKVEDG